MDKLFPVLSSACSDSLCSFCRPCRCHFTGPQTPVPGLPSPLSTPGSSLTSSFVFCVVLFLLFVCLVALFKTTTQVNLGKRKRPRLLPALSVLLDLPVAMRWKADWVALQPSLLKSVRKLWHFSNLFNLLHVSRFLFFYLFPILIFGQFPLNNNSLWWCGSIFMKKVLMERTASDYLLSRIRATSFIQENVVFYGSSRSQF